jgi:Xaa-Pro dipeptidase
MSAHHTFVDARLDRYAAALEGAGADAFVLTSEPALQHALGVRLYSQRLIPQRPVVGIVIPRARPICVCVEYEVGQLGLEAPGLELRPFGELSGDPWRLVADALAEAGARRVIVEDTFLASWLAALQERFAGEVQVSYKIPLEPRTIKDAEEIEVVREASRGAEIALATGAAILEPGRSEAEVARTIVLSFLERFGDRAGEVTGVCTAPQNNRAMHHRAGPATMPESGPVRVGLVGRLDGYWVLLTRMLVLGDDDRFERAYTSYAACYEENLASLRPGERCSELFAAADARLSAAGIELTSEKIGHGTGVDFRELPWVAADDDATLQPGTVLAYDYGADLDGYMLHVEDRVLVDVDGPHRLSDGWHLQDAREGFRRLL